MVVRKLLAKLLQRANEFHVYCAAHLGASKSFGCTKVSAVQHGLLLHDVRTVCCAVKHALRQCYELRAWQVSELEA